MDQLTPPEVTNEISAIQKLDFRMRQLQETARRNNDLDTYNRIGKKRMELGSKCSDLVTIGREFIPTR